MDDQFAEWHSVRPWHPTLSLSVREITSVSVTFILASPYSAHDSANPELASLGLSSSDDDDQSRDSTSTADTMQSQVVSDILTKGLSVKVNGTPWQRVILRMDDVLDEAVIILYGLMPSRQYDVELGILPGEASVRSQITTDTELRSEMALPEPLSEHSSAGSPESSTVPLSSSPPHMSGSSPNGHPPPTITLEDRRIQLTHTLNLLNAEHTSLTSTLKSARKESQKADAALRSEIDTLRRASDRHVAGESRARKKVLALQEAVKQTLAAARDTEALVKDIEAALPALQERKAEVEKEWEKVKHDAAKVKARRLEAEQREKARQEAMQVELAGLVNRLEKLNTKREKLEGEGGVLTELEERLRKLEEERERVEKDPYGYEGDAAAAAESEDSSSLGSRRRDRSKDGSSPEGDRPHSHNHNHNPHHPNFHPHQHVHPRKRHSHPHMQHHQHHHPRPSFPPPRGAPGSMAHQDPVHRPSGSAVRGTFSANGANHTVPGVIHLQQHGHPHNKPHANHNHHPRAPGFRPQGSSASGSSSASGAATPAASTLSGRAPPFEPGRSRTPSQSQLQAPQVTTATQAAAVAAKSELNPGSTPFAPRGAVASGVVGGPARMNA
ncbi:hypothetical protein L226DRAFT_530739 [Lentinus tigrinus ALCF2SS1-7]|uniref:Uncharacterized protein n=1 Tax=Lentinus tigrinus ALCF2SS1-6 TaxID=1328759 RepID=A0A5C2SQW7_9APHY|nr:hypothetical protein L227DRAFT_571020 [Lentinus tigrinus ALCF2SS1-6]RPD78857.1 hypothetical protein L226DRAFT_530739 [Lentinus tigrinus ALCF2SS1-7]